VKLSLGNSTKKSVPKPKTSDPKWEENFNFLVNDPRNQDFFVELWDSGKEKKLGSVVVSLKEVLKAPKMTVHRNFQLDHSADRATITLRLCLRILTTEEPEGWEADIPENATNVKPNVKDPANPGSSVDQPASKPTPAPINEPVSKSASKPAAPSSGPAAVAPPVAAPKGDPKMPDPYPGEDHQLMSQATVPLKSAPTEAAMARSGTDLRQRPAAAPPSKPDPGLGKIQMTFRYSQQRGKLICSVHKCVDLIPCDDENNSDPYVRIYLMPGEKEKRKTQVIKNNLNPIFDETFDWSIPWKDLESSSLEVIVKNSTGVFSKEKKEIGQINIELGHLDLTKSITEWYTLQPPDN